MYFGNTVYIRNKISTIHWNTFQQLNFNNDVVIWWLNFYGDLGWEMTRTGCFSGLYGNQILKTLPSLLWFDLIEKKCFNPRHITLLLILIIPTTTLFSKKHLTLLNYLWSRVVAKGTSSHLVASLQNSSRHTKNIFHLFVLRVWVYKLMYCVFLF